MLLMDKFIIYYILINEIFCIDSILTETSLLLLTYFHHLLDKYWK